MLPSGLPAFSVVEEAEEPLADSFSTPYREVKGNGPHLTEVDPYKNATYLAKDRILLGRTGPGMIWDGGLGGLESVSLSHSIVYELNTIHHDSWPRDYPSHVSV